MYSLHPACLILILKREGGGGSSIQERGFNSIPKQDVFYILWVGSANIVYIYILSRGEEF